MFTSAKVTRLCDAAGVVLPIARVAGELALRARSAYEEPWCTRREEGPSRCPRSRLGLGDPAVALASRRFVCGYRHFAPRIHVPWWKKSRQYSTNLAEAGATRPAPATTALMPGFNSTPPMMRSAGGGGNCFATGTRRCAGFVCALPRGLQRCGGEEEDGDWGRVANPNCGVEPD